MQEKEYENRAYLDYVKNIVDNGVTKSDRTGTGTVSLKGRAITFDLQEGFPLETSKKVSLDNIDKELRWFWRGDTSQRTLRAAGCNIWNDWADNQGRLGPVYGAMWRRRPVGFVEYIYKDRVPANPNVQAISAYKFFDVTEETQPRGRTALRRFVDGFIEKQDADSQILLSQYTAAATAWRHVIYNLATRAFERELDVNVDKRWTTFENFLDDFSTMAGNELVEIYPIGNEPAMDVMVYVLNHYGNGQFDKYSVQFIRREYSAFADKGMTALLSTPATSRNVLDAIFYVDQFAEVEALLAAGSNSRRIIVDGWEPSLLPLDFAKPFQQASFGRQALPPCHTLFQFYVDPQPFPSATGGDKNVLSLSLYQR